MKDEQLLSRYLLEDVSDEERERVEESYLTDDDLYLKLLVAEDELIAAYVEGELSRRDRAKFEKAYLTNPHRLRKVEATRELLEFFAEKPQPASQTGFLRSLLRGSVVWPRPVYALAGLALAVLCGLLFWAFNERQRTQGELEVVRERLRQVESDLQQQTTQTATPAPTGEEAAPPNASGTESRPAPPPPNAGGERKTREPESPRRAVPDGSAGGRAVASVLTFTLPRPGARTRGGIGRAPEPLVIPRNVALVRLPVKVAANEYTAYQVTVQKLGGPVVLAQTVNRDRADASGERVNVELPTSLLTDGDYILKVTGDDQILALHQVKVVRQNPPQR
jgi:hypothetical protein